MNRKKQDKFLTAQCSQDENYTQTLRHSDTQTLRHSARSVLIFSFPFLFGCGALRSAIFGESSISNIYSSTSGNDVVLTNTTSVSIPAGEYDGVKTCSVSSTTLLAENIKNGVSILGVLGTYVGSGSGGGGSSGVVPAFASMMHRDYGATQISLEQESVTSAGAAYNYAGYRTVPDISKDDDGFPVDNNINDIDAIKLADRTVDRSGWGTTACGNRPQDDTIDKKIAHCNSVFNANATWVGANKGISGEGTWVLVTRTDGKTNGLGREVWRDERTKLLWSSLVSRGSDGSSTGLNWCKASGNRQSDDPSGYCNDSNYQAQLPSDAISACAEGAGLTNIDPNGQIDNTGKGSLNLASTPSVAWRLPTINDYKLADVNGLRYVLPDSGVYNTYADAVDFPSVEWSSSVFSAYRQYGWIFYSSVGYFYYDDRTVSLSVRCVGR